MSVWVYTSHKIYRCAHGNNFLILGLLQLLVSVHDTVWEVNWSTSISVTSLQRRLVPDEDNRRDGGETLWYSEWDVLEHGSLPELEHRGALLIFPHSSHAFDIRLLTYLLTYLSLRVKFMSIKKDAFWTVWDTCSFFLCCDLIRSASSTGKTDACTPTSLYSTSSGEDNQRDVVKSVASQGTATSRSPRNWFSTTLRGLLLSASGRLTPAWASMG